MTSIKEWRAGHQWRDASNGVMHLSPNVVCNSPYWGSVLAKLVIDSTFHSGLVCGDSMLIVVCVVQYVNETYWTNLGTSYASCMCKPKMHSSQDRPPDPRKT